MKKLMMISGAVVAILSIEAKASTVAYWPLAGENGVRTTTETVFANEGDGGTMDAVPVTIRAWYGTLQTAESHPDLSDYYKYFPIGTNAFPMAYGVYDPVANVNKAAAAGLYFDSYKINWWSNKSIATNPGVLRVVDPDALKLTTFTVEFFVRPDSAKTGVYQCLTAMPLRTVTNGSTGTESWSLMLTNKKQLYFGCGTVDDGGNQSSRETSIASVASPQLFDGRWHHIAFSVDGKNLKIYADYALVHSATLSNEIQYAPDGDLFIGGSTHIPYSYYGSMAHFRISDGVLTSDKFLHFTRTERAADEPADVVFHLDFEPVDGLSTNKTVVFNRAATGSAVHLHTADDSTYAGYAKFDTDVYTNKIYSSRKDYKGKDSTRIFSKTDSNQGNPYFAWYPDEDIFHNYSFTVEMFEKASSFNNWGTFLKRRTSSSTGSQFALCINNKSKKLMALIAGNSSITDTVTIDDNTWHHIAVVCDKTNGTYTFFRDWRQTGSASLSADIKAIEGYPPIVFCGDPGDHTYFVGKLGDVRITKRALGVKEFLSPEYAKGFVIVIQ